ncbi:unnamed protein product [Nezara viridula]|uniref:Uncharacterized protein n=1 Tax=Nezara viridula TaxID=85310 RepID=A0A9P0EBL5_NEZVI|nr:unnamed protein product [Nezara viridula]
MHFGGPPVFCFGQSPETCPLSLQYSQFTTVAGQIFSICEKPWHLLHRVTATQSLTSQDDQFRKTLPSANISFLTAGDTSATQ